MKGTIKTMGKEVNIFEVIRKSHNLKNYCETCGINLVSIGISYRANSPFTGANNAFRIDKNEPDYWYDHSLNRGGDIIEFSAMLYHDGDKRAALLELAPEGYSAKIDKYFRDKQAVQDYIIGAHNNIPEYIIKYFESRGVDLEQINRLNLGCRAELFKNWLVIPHVDFNGDFCYYRLRRAPDEQGDENETLQPEKYKCAYIGDNSFLKNIPLGLQTLNRKSKYLVPVERDFDYLNFEREGFAVIGTGGSSGITEEILQIICDNADNKIPVLAFDNDDAGRKYALDGALKLFKRKITFYVAVLPDNCKDVNDYYRVGGDLQKLCDDATPGLEYIAESLIPDEDFTMLSRGRQNTLKKNIKDFFIECRRAGADNADIQTLCECLEKKGLPEKWLAEIKAKSEHDDTDFEITKRLQEQYNLLFNEKTGFYKYDTELEAWQQSDDTTVGSYVYDYLGLTSTARKINAVVELIKKAVNSAVPVETFNKLPLIPLKNGTIHLNLENLRQSQFLLASPNDYVTSRREYEYNQYANCDEWLQTLQVIFAGDERRIKCLQEFCGYAWLPDCRFQKSLELRGTGSNGKSLILNVLKKLYGDKNCSSLEIADLAKDFQRINLLYSFINISTEESAYIKEAESTLKKAVAGETITGCYKMKDYITFNPRAKFFFACNENIKISSKTYAMLRRFLLIDCPVRFIDDEPDGNNPFECKKDFGLEARLTTPESLSGIFIWTMRGLIRLLKQGKFTETAEQAELSSTFTAKTDSIDNFVAECNSEWQSKKFTRAEIYTIYLEYCEKAGIDNPVANQNFHSAFTRALADKKIPVRNGQ